MSKVVLENLTKYFGETRAAENISLKIEDGEFFALLGPSGCGKTTALRLIAGLEKPDRGNIFFDGEKVNNLPPAERNVGLVFQNYMLYPHKTAFENMSFPLEVRDFPEDRIEEKVEETASILEIGDLLNRKPKNLSGGERQRTALGRALVREPRVFLMDEPLANLDAKLRTEMRTELQKLQEKIGVTTIYVTHDQVEAMTMADRIATMNDGLVHQVDSPSELYTKPKDTWVARFIGSPSMNLLACDLEGDGEEPTLEGRGFSISLKKEIADLIRKSNNESELKLGIRPSDFSVSKEEEKESIKAEVYSIEPKGKTTLITATTGNKRVKAEISHPPHDLSLTDIVYLVPDKSVLYLYDKNDELLAFTGEI